MPDVGQELLNVPFPEMVEKLALGIAEAQTKLDTNSVKVAKFMADTKFALPDIAGSGEVEFSMLAMGFFPGFYQFQEANIEVRMAITMATTSQTDVAFKGKAGWGPFSASINASYSRKYEYKVEGSSLLRVKLAPAPPPAILQDYMDALIAVRSKELKDKKDAVLPPPPPGPPVLPAIEAKAKAATPK